jgi:hypothetical protein
VQAVSLQRVARYVARCGTPMARAVRRRHATVRVVRLMLCVVLWFALWSVRDFFFALIAANQTPVAGTQTSHRCAWLSCGVCCACALLDWAKGGLCGGRAAVRCARAQGNGGGGVLSMAKGTALFDAVAISDTAAGVRARQGGNARQAAARWGGCGRTGCAADLWRVWPRRLCAGRQWRRGAHGRWGRHVQGRNDLACRGGACARCVRPSHAANARA